MLNPNKKKAELGWGKSRIKKIKVFGRKFAQDLKVNKRKLSCFFVTSRPGFVRLSIKKL
jgi:hypothetical protein